jgi:hypothetical protein
MSVESYAEALTTLFAHCFKLWLPYILVTVCADIVTGFKSHTTAVLQ